MTTCSHRSMVDGAGTSVVVVGSSGGASVVVVGSCDGANVVVVGSCDGALTPTVLEAATVGVSGASVEVVVDPEKEGCTAGTESTPTGAEGEHAATTKAITVILRAKLFTRPGP